MKIKCRYKRINEKDIINFLELQLNKSRRGGFIMNDFAKFLCTSIYQVKKYLYILLEKGLVTRKKVGGGCIIITETVPESHVEEWIEYTPVRYIWSLK